MDLVVDPPRGVGPIEIGMLFEVAESALRTIPGFRPAVPGSRHNPGFAHYDSEMSISVGKDSNGRVRAIEVYRLTWGVDVLFRGISIFAVPADEIVRLLSRIDVLEIQDDGLRVLAPNLLLSLWRGTLPDGPEDEDGRYFEAILVAAPGYYDH
jgi:hypothetical protein